LDAIFTLNTLMHCARVRNKRFVACFIDISKVNVSPFILLL
jgi:hypothetical protein